MKTLDDRDNHALCVWGRGGGGGGGGGGLSRSGAYAVYHVNVS